MRLLPFIFTLVVLTGCGSSSGGDRPQNSVNVQFTDIDGKIFDTNEKVGEYLKISAKDGVLVLERVMVDGSRSRYDFEGDITSHTKHGNKEVYWAQSHFGDSKDKFIFFGIDRENHTIDSLYQDYGADYHVPQARLTKFFGDLRWDGK